MPTNFIVIGFLYLVLLISILFLYKVGLEAKGRGDHRGEYFTNFSLEPRFVYIVVPILVMAVLTNLQAFSLRDISPPTDNPLMVLLFKVLTGPFIEEAMFRGLLLGAFFVYAEKLKTDRKNKATGHLATAFGLLLTGYLFAGWHYFKHGVMIGISIIATGDFLMFPTGQWNFIKGIVYGLFFYWSKKSLWSSYAAHSTNNFIGFLYEYSIL